MGKVLLILAMVLAAGGCRRQQAPPAGPVLSQEEAMQALWQLPEVEQWADGVRSKSHGRTIPICIALDAPPDPASAGAPAAWVFDLAESRGSESIPWNRFRVDASTGAISVWDAGAECYLSVNLWRVRTGRE